MADTRILRQRLDQQLRDIQDKLRAVDLVEAMSAELVVNGAEPGLSVKVGEKTTIIEACRAVALADLSRQWTVSTMTSEVQRRGHPNATRANVTTSLRRLAKDGGILDIISRSKRTGFAYRARTAKAAS